MRIKKKYKLLAFDLDGTLINPLESDLMSPGTLEILNRLHKKGVIISINTGRNIFSAKKMIEKHNEAFLNNCMVSATNGAVVYDMSRRSAIKAHHINRDDSLEIIKIILDTGLVPLVHENFYDGARIFRSSKKVNHVLQSYLDHRIRQMEDENVVVTDDSIYSGLSFDPLEIMTIDRKEPVFEASEKITVALGGKVKIINTGTLLEREKHIWLEVFDGCSSKGHGLKEIADYLNVSLENTIAVGDNYNDIEMLEECGLAIAMGDAPDSVKNIADIVTGTVNEDGVSTILEKLDKEGYF